MEVITRHGGYRMWHKRIVWYTCRRRVRLAVMENRSKSVNKRHIIGGKNCHDPTTFKRFLRVANSQTKRFSQHRVMADRIRHKQITLDNRFTTRKGSLQL